MGSSIFYCLGALSSIVCAYKNCNVICSIMFMNVFRSLYITDPYLERIIQNSMSVKVSICSKFLTEHWRWEGAYHIQIQETWHILPTHITVLTAMVDHKILQQVWNRQCHIAMSLQGQLLMFHHLQGKIRNEVLFKKTYSGTLILYHGLM